MIFFNGTKKELFNRKLSPIQWNWMAFRKDFQWMNRLHYYSMASEYLAIGNFYFAFRHFSFLALLSLWWTFFKISTHTKSILVNKDKTIIVGWTIPKVLYIFYGSYSGTFYYYLKIFCKHRRSGHVSLWQRLHSSGPFAKYLIFEIMENWA